MSKVDSHMSQVERIVHVVLIDDEPSELSALTLLLQALGFSVSGFGDPSEALAYLAKDRKADVCICDLRMPKVDGMHTLVEAKRLRPDLPFILMSGHASDEEFDEARRKGAAGFLSKPFQPEEVKTLVGQCLRS